MVHPSSIRITKKLLPATRPESIKAIMRRSTSLNHRQSIRNLITIPKSNETDNLQFERIITPHSYIAIT